MCSDTANPDWRDEIAEGIRAYNDPRRGTSPLDTNTPVPGKGNITLGFAFQGLNTFFVAFYPLDDRFSWRTLDPLKLVRPTMALAVIYGVHPGGGRPTADSSILTVLGFLIVDFTSIIQFQIAISFRLQSFLENILGT
mmetsp:Transcript_6285/g.12473  ORF Transcript_6285/g.12473 Transcript_6285/m.12473 type:complete len:138 (-) Transcript_6285:3425-3838(-)